MYVRSAKTKQGATGPSNFRIIAYVFNFVIENEAHRLYSALRLTLHLLKFADICIYDKNRSLSVELSGMYSIV